LFADGGHIAAAPSGWRNPEFPDAGLEVTAAVRLICFHLSVAVTVSSRCRFNQFVFPAAPDIAAPRKFRPMKKFVCITYKRYDARVGAGVYQNAPYRNH
jgi:hypothetical protein